MGHTEGYVSVVLCRYPDISKHLKNVFDTGELEKDKTHNKNFQNLQRKVLFPPVILCPANGLNQAVHGLAEGDADAFIVGSELVGPRGQQQQQAGGTVVRAVGRGMVYLRESIACCLPLKARQSYTLNLRQLCSTSNTYPKPWRLTICWA